MAVASAEPITTTPIPLVAKAHLRAFVSRTQDAVTGITITYLDDQGRRVGSSLCSFAEVERHARDLLAIVAAARMAGDIGPAAAPRTETVLMDGLTQHRPPIAPAEPAAATELLCRVVL
ncbi:MAG: hypothetical protein QHC65_14180 [Sphingomonas sp.]|nr:hypothetical protein [Sphingomonas sp.]MDX3885565.1 hypothetical protein [Sphingomonas sp.]